EFSRAFFQSDRLLVLPIYAASEARIEGVDSRILCDQIHAFGYKEVLYVESFDAAIGELRRMLQPGDIVLTLGAGDVWKVGETLLADLRSNPPAQ
ncbi:MAG: UDP-N-acetylmuramate--L-alanine ligase, partial [Desulfobacterales bacterium]|nr:UDP-N-acetylmuramate--L-alanine ligase [Desulfobacterales bacterium]